MENVETFVVKHSSTSDPNDMKFVKKALRAVLQITQLICIAILLSQWNCYMHAGELSQCIFTFFKKAFIARGTEHGLLWRIMLNITLLDQVCEYEKSF